MGEASCFFWKGLSWGFLGSFFWLVDLIQWMMWPNKNSPQITGQHRWRSKTLWNELRNSDLTNPLSSSRFQLAPPQTRKMAEKHQFWQHVWFWLLANGVFGARPYTSSFFFVWQGTLPQRHGAISGLHPFLRLCQETQFFRRLRRVLNLPKRPKVWVRLHRVFHPFWA